MKESNLTIDDSSLYTTQLMLDRVKTQCSLLQKSLRSWYGKLTIQDIFEMSFMLNLHKETVKSYIKHGSKRVNFKVHIALAILCYLECNYAHKK